MPVKTSYEHGQFNWVDVASHDMAGAKPFYCDLFGWTVTDLGAEGGPPYAQFEKDGNSVCGIGQMNEQMKAQGIPPLWNSYINVDSVEEIAQKADKLGASITVPPMKVLDAGWLSFFLDPTGASVALWQKDQHIGAGLVNDPGSYCWNELITKDVDKAKSFYADLLGWEYEVTHMSGFDYHMVKNKGQNNAGIMAQTPEMGDFPSMWGVYFNVKDLNGFVSRLKDKGGNVLREPFDTPIGPMAIVTDPQGALFSLIQFDPATMQ